MGQPCPYLSVNRLLAPRTWAKINASLVTGSSSSLSTSSLNRLPSAEIGVTLRSRFSVVGSDAKYSDTVDGDYSDFGEAFSVQELSNPKRKAVDQSTVLVQAARDLIYKVTLQR